MITKICHNFMKRSWWVVAFLLLCVLFYEKGMQKREWHYTQLKEQLALLKAEKAAALKKQQNLKLQINSQSDLSWIELTLMKGLGLSPEDQQKVYFTEHQID